MRAKFGGDPTAGSKNLPFKFNNRYITNVVVENLESIILEFIIMQQTIDVLKQHQP